jgi:hypothetical protein
MALVDAQRRTSAWEYTRAWQIFFNTFQRVDQRNDKARVRAQARAKAEAAWKRLQRGDSFDRVAGLMSEDQMSKNVGGSLGFIAKSAYGTDFQNMLAKLKPGEVSRPFESMYGWHIIKWAPIRDDQLLAISKMEYGARTTADLIAKVTSKARVERYEK